ncbi:MULTISPECIES: hypothetical protein [unclassified Paenibacillus]|uniref:hypothetical protein n=1 Tax=unclassified Paenibacillus TaxID=185978 RepID=UPI001AE919C2|nr:MULTISPECIES: hypothetical protein [unclassified Paenibacillus]MBP1156894.1 hypothetical protein [Paenibacillus sp. PvP091]MBP1172367.1 hypothetical protein [Paenibacillus sp. PvR098]MBP2438748.1 hypothetical protein [Paenibacillus sp. PvP052]
MKIIEHPFRPGTVSFYNELTGKRSYWFSAHNLFTEVMDNEEAIELMLNWGESEVEQAVVQSVLSEEHWVSDQTDYESAVVSPVKK